MVTATRNRAPKRQPDRLMSSKYTRCASNAELHKMMVHMLPAQPAPLLRGERTERGVNRTCGTTPDSLCELQASGKVGVPRLRLRRQHFRRSLNFPARWLEAGVDDQELDEGTRQEGVDRFRRKVAESNPHLVRNVAKHSRSVQTSSPRLGIGTHAPQTLEELSSVPVV